MCYADDSKTKTVQSRTVAQRASSEGVLGLSSTLDASWVQLLCFCPRCPSVVPQDTWGGGLSSGQKAEPMKGHIGESPSGLGPNQRITKGRRSQGQREEWCFLTSSRLASCRLSRTVALCLEQPVAWNLWDLVVRAQWGTHHLSVHDISVDKNIK